MRGATQRVGVAIALQEIAARRARQLRIDVEFRLGAVLLVRIRNTHSATHQGEICGLAVG